MSHCLECIVAVGPNLGKQAIMLSFDPQNRPFFLDFLSKIVLLRVSQDSVQRGCLFPKMFHPVLLYLAQDSHSCVCV